MKKLLFISLMILTTVCNGQTKWHIDTTLSGHAQSIYSRQTYPKLDTVKCHFLEVINDSSFVWETGFVERKDGFIKFSENTQVQPPYLPVTSGIVLSKLFYLNMQPIKNYAIKVIIVPTGKIRTSALGL